MKLNTRKVTVKIPVSDDGATITAKKVSKEVYLAALHPVLCVLFDDNDKGMPFEEQKAEFEKRVTNLMSSGNVDELLKIRNVMAQLFTKMVDSWERIEDEEGNFLECTTENINLVAELNPDFCCDFVTKALDEIQKKEEALEKN